MPTDDMARDIARRPVGDWRQRRFSIITRPMRGLVGALSAVILVLYPGLVWYGLNHWQPRLTVLVLLPVLLMRGLVGLRAAQRAQMRAVAHIPLAVAALLIAAAVLDSRDAMLATPVLVNAVLLASFALSLRTVPVAERIARMRDPELPPEAIRYCRSVTKVWCVFFVVNGGVALVLARFATLSWWAWYTGLISYLAMGTLAASELSYRKVRFRRYGDGPYDRLLARFFPPVRAS